jgi:hypothetical protein
MVAFKAQLVNCIELAGRVTMRIESSRAAGAAIGIIIPEGLQLIAGG